MSKIIKFGLTQEDYVKLGKKAFADGDIEKSITTLKNGIAKYGRFAEASIALAEVYSSIGALDLSNSVLFAALANEPKDDDRDLIFYQLAMNFYDEHKFDVAEYYLRDIAEKFDIQFPEGIWEEPAADGKGFRIVYPHGEDYYQMLIEQAYDLIHEEKFDEAIALMDSVDPNSKAKIAANHVALVCLMMKNDLDGVVANAQKILQENGDNLSAKCTLTTALLMEEKTAEAYLILDDILKKDYNNPEEILMLLHLLVNMEIHSEIVKYTKRLLEKFDYQPNTMIWLSQALYNLGQKDEALRVMNKVDAIYGPYFPSEFFIELYKENPEHVAYTIGVPYMQKLKNRKALEAFFKLDRSQARKALSGDGDDDTFLKKLLYWVFANEEDAVKIAVLDRVFEDETEWVERFVRKQLISGNLSFELMSRLICYLLDGRWEKSEFCVVAQDRFKEVRIVFPVAFGKMPKVMERAYIYCLADIIFTDEEQNYYLDRLTDIINSIVTVDDNVKLKFYNKNDRIARLKSMRTLVGVFLCKVYEEDEDSYEVTIERYGLNRKTFDKYYKIVFGDGENEK